MSAFDSKNFIYDISKVFTDSLFLSSYIREQNSQGKACTPGDCFDMASNFVQTYHDPSDGSTTVQDLRGMINNFKNLMTAVTQIKDMQATDIGYDELVTAAKNNFDAVMKTPPTLREQLSSFISDAKKKGASLGEDGMRMLNSMLQMADNISNRYSLEPEERFDLFANDRQELQKKSDELQKKIDNFAERCAASGAVPMNLNDQVAKKENRIENLQKELQEVKTAEYQKKHTEDYEACKVRVQNLKSGVTNTKNKIDQIQAKMDEINKLEQYFNFIQPEIASKKDQIRRQTYQASDFDRKIKSIDEKLAAEEQHLTEYNEAREMINSMGLREKNHIGTMNLYLKEDKILENGLQRIGYMNQGKVDISESFRTLREGDDLTTIEPSKMQAVQYYLDIKRQILDVFPEKQDKFNAYEADPDKKIPADFMKEIGNDIKDVINDRKDYINQIRETDYYKNYEKANNVLAIGESNLNVIKGMKAQKAYLEKQAQNCRKHIEDLTTGINGWKEKAKEVLGYACPKDDKLSLGSASIAGRQLYQTLNNQLKTAQMEAKELEKKAEREGKTLKRLEEGFAPIKTVKLELEIKKETENLEAMKQLKSELPDLEKGMKELHQDTKSVIESAKEATPNPYETIKNRLSYIHDHFNDVQSFWSKGMSKPCEEMYKSLESAMEKLGAEEINKDDVTAALQNLGQKAQQYLGAKNAQNIPKFFASEQRFWRLSFAEEIVGVTQNGQRMIDKLEDPKMKMMKDFAEKGTASLNKGPEKDLGSKLMSSFDNEVQRIKQVNEASKQKDNLEAAPIGPGASK